MKKWLVCAVAVMTVLFFCSLRCRAATVEELSDSLLDLRANVSDEVREKMESIGCGDILSVGSIDLDGLLSLLSSELGEGLAGPLLSIAVVIGVLLLASMLEGYTYSLRYTETKDVMAAVTSLATATALITPLVSLIRRTVGVISDTSALMLLYVPIMAAILGFSGHVIRAGGYCATVMTASQVIAQLASHCFAPMLCCHLALSVASGVSGRVKLSGICELLGRLIKWSVTGMMTLFAGVLSLQSVMARAGDTVASRAARFTLSSVIPLVGSAISEAYRTLQGSVDLLRSGAGVFVIVAVIVAFLPVLVQAALWLLSIRISHYVADALGVTTPASLLSAVASVIAALIALIVCVMAVFMISTAVLIRIGGAS